MTLSTDRIIKRRAPTVVGYKITNRGKGVIKFVVNGVVMTQRRFCTIGERKVFCELITAKFQYLSDSLEMYFEVSHYEMTYKQRTSRKKTSNPQF